MGREETHNQIAETKRMKIVIALHASQRSKILQYESDAKVWDLVGFDAIEYSRIDETLRLTLSLWYLRQEDPNWYLSKLGTVSMSQALCLCPRHCVHVPGTVTMSLAQ
jgi:hypothetical protein